MVSHHFAVEKILLPLILGQARGAVVCIFEINEIPSITIGVKDYSIK